MFKSGLYNTIGAVLRLGLGFLTAPLLIHLLGLNTYGIWALIWANIGVLGLGEAGFSVSSTVFVAKDVANKDYRGLSETLTIIMSIMLFLTTSFALLLWVSADFLITSFFGLKPEEQLQAMPAFQVGALVLWTRLLIPIFVGILQAFDKYGIQNIIMTSSAVFGNLALLIVALFDKHLVAIMWGQVVISAATLLVYVFFVVKILRPFHLYLAWSRQRSITIIRFSLLTWSNLIGTTLFSQCDRIIVGVLLHTRLLAVYSAITSIGNQLNNLSAVPVQPLLPVMSNLTANNNEVDYAVVQQKIRWSVYINGILTLGMGATLFTLAPLIIPLLLTNVTASETNLFVLAFRVAIVIYAIYSTNAVGYYVLFGINAANINTFLTIAGSVLSLAFIGLGSSLFGLVGGVAGNLAYAITWLCNYFSLKKLNIPIRLWFVWIKFPLVWFFASILLAVWLAQDILTSILVTFLQSVVFATWFLLTQRANFQPIFKMFRRNR